MYTCKGGARSETAATRSRVLHRDEKPPMDRVNRTLGDSWFQFLPQSFGVFALLLKLYACLWLSLFLLACKKEKMPIWFGLYPCPWEIRGYKLATLQ